MSTFKQKAAAEHARFKKEEKRLAEKANRNIDSINRRLEREGRSDEKIKKLKYDSHD